MASRLPQTKADLGRVVKRVFPEARPDPEGWRVPRPAGARQAAETGTYDPKTIFFGVAEGKTGLTFYVLYPGDYFVLEKHGAPLAEAGYKVMRGCLRWSRKGEPPLAPLEDLMRRIRAADGMDR